MNGSAKAHLLRTNQFLSDYQQITRHTANTDF